MRYVDDDYCFACGENNPLGLHLRFDETEDGVKGTFIAKREHQGYQGMMHGGLMMTLLDEALAWAVAKKHGAGATAELNVRIKRFGPIGTRLTLIGRITGRRMRMVQGESCIMDSDGQVVASATGKFMLSEHPSDHGVRPRRSWE